MLTTIGSLRVAFQHRHWVREEGSTVGARGHQASAQPIESNADTVDGHMTRTRMG
jgi:hypothetical protein